MQDPNSIPDPALTSDADPGGVPDMRRPGEAVFDAVILVASLALLWSAYDISGFEALSAPGTVPMMTTLVMVITAGLVLYRSIRLPIDGRETVKHDILPFYVIVLTLLLVGYAVLLVPLGFLPTSALFLILAIKLLWQRSWLVTFGVSAFALVLIYLVFRIVFTVLMPTGIVPEAEMIQWIRNLLSGGQA
ncbi:MAG: tripartite tricarboxylate transporter TctB family protein [Rhodobacteraceae bacterium]|nr:tripartite tricarboxylate transporter TctB family protein [Paracoccaceae bacterium]